MIMELDFQKGKGLLPAIIQDCRSQQVLMLGYMNEEAYHKTIESGKVTFFSRSKQRLWTKGETSGNFMLLESINIDCDGDTLLVKVQPQGPACHKGTISCFGEDQPALLSFLAKLQDIIKQRKAHPSPGSYTASLLESGVLKIAQKVGEEAVEVVIEAAAGDSGNLKEESADLLFHLMVLLEQKGMSLDDVVGVLRERHSA